MDQNDGVAGSGRFLEQVRWFLTRDLVLEAAADSYHVILRTAAHCPGVHPRDRQVLRAEELVVAAAAEFSREAIVSAVAGEGPDSSTPATAATVDAAGSSA